MESGGEGLTVVRVDFFLVVGADSCSSLFLAFLRPGSSCVPSMGVGAVLFLVTQNKGMRIS